MPGMARSPLRVVVVSRAVMPLHGVGGLERSTRDLVRHLAGRDVDVTLITPPPAGGSATPTAEAFASPRITLRHIPYVTFPFANRRGTTIIDRSTAYLLWGRRAGRAALSLANQGRADVVHSQGAAALGYARAKDRGEASAPLVLNPHGLEEFGSTGAALPPARRLGYAPLRRAVRRCARAADCVIATDRSLEPVIARHLDVAADRIRLVPNGIDLAEADGLAGPADGARIRAQHGIGPGEIVLVSAGRLQGNKGLDQVPAALSQALAGGLEIAPGWRWIVAGSGPHRRRIESAVAAHGLGARVIFTGRTSEADLHAWYEGATIFLHPTRYEGSSLVTLEAMAHRKPVVATRAGGLPDKVKPGVNGWLVEPDDPSQLARAIADAVAQVARLPEMGARSRAIVEDEFAWSAIVARQLAVYDEVLGRS